MGQGVEQRALDEATEWFVRRDTLELSADEARAFATWLRNPENRTAYAEIAGTWEDLARVARPAIEPRPATRRVFNLTYGLGAAAAMLLALGLGYLLDIPIRLEADGYTAVGERKTLILPDGSKAVLNTDSALAIAYETGVRRVRLLRGEAVFTVEKDPSRPFLVDAAGGEARALGTAFDVRIRADGATVIVIESRVGVSYPIATAASATVAPNQAVDYSSSGLDAVHPADASAETAWLRGKLIFVDRPLGSVIAEINRYHRGSIRIVDGGIRDQPVSGVFDTRDPVHVVDLLQQSLGVKSTRLTNRFILLHR